MGRTWAFGRKVGLGFAGMVALAGVLSIMAIASLRSVVASKDDVIAFSARNLVEAARLDTATQTKVSAARGFLLTREARFLEQGQRARSALLLSLRSLETTVRTEHGQALVERVRQAEAAHQEALEKVVGQRQGDAPLAVVSELFESLMVPRQVEMDEALRALVTWQQQRLQDANREASDQASTAQLVLGMVAVLAVVVAVVVAWLLTRSLSSQIGAAVLHVQSSSTELQTAANQQATGAREQATAMAEITTTISELLATARQIAECAPHVAQIARDTSTATESGEAVVERATGALGTIKTQVDLIVSHMLDLGNKSQQIGGIVDIINELAEQTNILAINATIEAAGAGEAGKRFGVVADEIRKLADRVGASTKEIRGLIEDVRAAVNGAVMTTEGGLKAVESGSRHFTDVSAALARISELIGTTTDAAREIELSTKQQSSAVEQVNAAIANVAQVTRETETSSNQTFQTASQLSGLSQKLTQLIQPAVRA